MIVTNIIHIGKISSSAAEYSHIRWEWERHFFFLPKEATAILHVFWLYAKRSPFSSNSTHSEQPWQISLNALLTPYPSSTHTLTYTQTYHRSLLSPHNHFSSSFSFFFFLPGYHSVAVHEGKESALICQSEQPFHRASLHSVPVPEWELLISPGRFARLLGSPR